MVPEAAGTMVLMAGAAAIGVATVSSLGPGAAGAPACTVTVCVTVAGRGRARGGGLGGGRGACETEYACGARGEATGQKSPATGSFEHLSVGPSGSSDVVGAEGSPARRRLYPCRDRHH
ncbi:hypothetical protein MMAD_00400 [Mycolicibacterium madagascariense]|uniref:Uncharacterized protein n=1 Tax=Mycolicibacterium madagascariense TaxID=212765 RepID=A0A7I7X926_9MYCO|nr:hypothetical protein MMAD_00400 [Mycolicibacterium madagascariense]